MKFTLNVILFHIMESTYMIFSNSDQMLNVYNDSGESEIFTFRIRILYLAAK